MKNSLIFFVILVAAFPIRAGASDCPQNQMDPLKKMASSLNKSRIESVLKMADEFQRQAQGQALACREAMFHEFHRFYEEAEGLKSQTLGSLGKLTEEKKKQLESEISKVGWKLSEAEGYFHLVEDPNWARQRFSSVLPDSWAEYFHLKAQEMEDASSVQWSLLVKKISGWETFLKKHSEFPEKEEIEGYLNNHIQALLTGTATASLFHEGAKNAGKLREDARKAYEQFIKTQKDSRYYETVKGYYEKLKSNGFKWAKDCEAFLTAHGIRTYPGMTGGGN